MTEVKNDAANKFQESIEAWSKIVKFNAEQGLARATLAATIESTEESNRLLGWILGVTGVTIGLIVGNITEVSKIIEAQAVKCALILLLVSGFLGLISKALSFYVGVYRLVIRELTALMTPIFNDFYNEHDRVEALARPYIEPPKGELNWENVIKEISEPYNSLERRAVRKGFENGQKDPLYIYKKATRLCRWHGYFLMLQVLLLVLSYATLIKNL